MTTTTIWYVQRVIHDSFYFERCKVCYRDREMRDVRVLYRFAYSEYDTGLAYLFSWNRYAKHMRKYFIFRAYFCSCHFVRLVSARWTGKVNFILYSIRSICGCFILVVIDAAHSFCDEANYMHACVVCEFKCVWVELRTRIWSALWMIYV